MVAANAAMLRDRWAEIPSFLAALQQSAQAFINGGEASLEHLQSNFKLNRDDAIKWMGKTKYVCSHAHLIDTLHMRTCTLINTIDARTHTITQSHTR